MDFVALTELFVPIVVLGCLAAGYIIKTASFLKWIPNGDIPCILAAIGVGVNILVSGLSVETVIMGLIMGLASTGLYKQFRNWIENRKNKAVEETE